MALAEGTTNQVEMAEAAHEKAGRQEKAERCWFAALGPGGGVEPSPRQCSDSVTNWGRELNSATVRSKISNGEPIHIVVLGTSVSCGCMSNTAKGIVKGVNHTRAWPLSLETALRSSYHAPVTVTNLCKAGPLTLAVSRSHCLSLYRCLSLSLSFSSHCLSLSLSLTLTASTASYMPLNAGVGTDFFIQKIAARSPSLLALQSADIVMVETSLSDSGNKEDWQTRNAEVLVNLLQNLGHKPFIMFLAASWFGYQSGSHSTHYSAAERQLRVMKHYGVAYTSMVAMFKPIERPTNELPSWYKCEPSKTPIQVLRL